jgi:myosin I
VASIDDNRDFKEVQLALKSIPTFSAEAIENLWRILAGIIRLGNIRFSENGSNGTNVVNWPDLQATARLLVTPEQLSEALCEQVVAARGDVVSKEHDMNAALYTRDALGKVCCLLWHFSSGKIVYFR